jgi:hypothetical protein
MTPTQAKHYAAAVEQAEEAFKKRVSEIAGNARSAMLQYFADNRLTFVSGNGIWIVEDTKKPTNHPGRRVNDEDLPTEIAETLNLEVAHGDHLGFYMQPITRKDWKS